ncbi:MAG: MOSC domain-containing protein [Pseudomonadota bacterium]
MPGSVLAIYATLHAGEDLLPLATATLEAGRGIVGDRYFEHSGTFSDKLKDTKDWEVTLIEQEEVERFNTALGKALGPGSFRRNIVTVGVRLNDLVGHRFKVGNAVLEGVRLCEPCAYLATLLGPEVVKAMSHRVGLRARIVAGAKVLPGDRLIERAA